MSDAHDAQAAGAHGVEAHDHFDAEPVRTLPAGEPRTPGWVPAFGLALFVVLGVAFLVSVREDAPEASSSAAPAVTAQPATPTVLRPRPVPPASAAAQRPTPPVQGSALPAPGSVKRLSPEQVKQLRERLKELQQRQGSPPQGGQARPATPPAPGTER